MTTTGARLCRDAQWKARWPGVLRLREEGPHPQALPANLEEGKDEDTELEEQQFQEQRLRRVLHKNKDQEDDGVINQAVKEETSSEEEEDENKKGAAYTKACIEHLMRLGPGHPGP